MNSERCLIDTILFPLLYTIKIEASRGHEVIKSRNTNYIFGNNVNSEFGVGQEGKGDAGSRCWLCNALLL